jgi:hypothetical protein
MDQREEQKSEDQDQKHAPCRGEFAQKGPGESTGGVEAALPFPLLCKGGPVHLLGIELVTGFGVRLELVPELADRQVFGKALPEGGDAAGSLGLAVTQFLERTNGEIPAGAVRPGHARDYSGTKGVSGRQSLVARRERGCRMGEG